MYYYPSKILHLLQFCHPTHGRSEVIFFSYYSKFTKQSHVLDHFACTRHYWKLGFFSVCAKTHRKIRIPSEKYFSDGVPSEKYPQKYDDRKIQLFCVFAVRNNFSVGVTRTEKLRQPRLNLNVVCVYPHRKKEKPDRKMIFLQVLHAQKNCVSPD